MAGRNRKELVLESHKQEALVYGWLRMWLPTIRRAKYADHYDMIYGDKRIEVKAAHPQADGSWFFNIHRHGVLNEDGIHAYVFRLESVPGFKAALHLIIPAPLGRLTVSLSLRSLVMYWGRFANRIDFIDPAVPRPRAVEYLDELESRSVTTEEELINAG